MQRALATDGVEWAAAEMTFLVNGIVNAILNRTQQWAGTGGVFAGGVVSNPSGFTLATTGPLTFTANGELGIIASPANVTAQANTTNYVIAKYSETQDTPATYYGGGSPPNLHANETPTVLCRTSPAVLADGEVPLATVVTNGSIATSITDTRVILPTVSSGNIVLGTGRTVDGMDPSVHQALVATSAVLGHVLLGAAGGATPYNTLRGAWKKEFFLDVGATFAATKILDDADFTSPPASSQPFATLAQAFETEYIPTRDGSLQDSVYGPRIAARYTLTFTATAVAAISMALYHYDDTVRVKANGVSLTTHNAASNGQAELLTFNTVNGTNTIVVYVNNTGGNQFHINLACSVLTDTGDGVIFTG